MMDQYFSGAPAVKTLLSRGFLGSSAVRNLTARAGRYRLSPWSGRIPGLGATKPVCHHYRSQHAPEPMLSPRRCQDDEKPTQHKAE